MYPLRDISFRLVYDFEGQYYDVCIPKNQDAKFQQVQTAYVLNGDFNNKENACTFLKITLCKDGLMIGSKEDGGYLKVDGQLDHCDYCAPVAIDRKYDERRETLWTLKEAKSMHDDDKFYVEMTYGEVRPRLALEKLTKSNQIRLNVITRDLSEKIKLDDMRFRILKVE